MAHLARKLRLGEDTVSSRSRIHNTLMRVLPAAAALIVPMITSPAFAYTVDFSAPSFEHGTVINTQYQSSLGLTIAAANGGVGPDMAVVFNSTLQCTEDSDLEDPFEGASSGSKNLSTANLRSVSATVGPKNPGNILIVQENSTGCGDGDCNYPDDEAGGPNRLLFLFTDAVTIESLDFFDLDTSEKVWISFYNDNNFTATTNFNDASNYPNLLTASNSTKLIDYVSIGSSYGYSIGDNRTATFKFGSEGIGGVKALLVHYTGSGAVDNLKFNRPAPPPPPTEVPIPGTAWLLGTGLLGLGWLRRRPANRAVET